MNMDIVQELTLRVASHVAELELVDAEFLARYRRASAQHAEQVSAQQKLQSQLRTALTQKNESVFPAVSEKLRARLLWFYEKEEPVLAAELEVHRMEPLACFDDSLLRSRAVIPHRPRRAAPISVATLQALQHALRPFVERIVEARVTSAACAVAEGRPVSLPTVRDLVPAILVCTCMCVCNFLFPA
jgi:hypothetical protein